LSLETSSTHPSTAHPLPAIKSPNTINATSPQNSQLPTIAVIVPVRNEERYIDRALEDLLGQDYPADRYEVLVVDGCSNDRTRTIALEYAARYSRVLPLDNPKRWSSAARNVGIQRSQAEIVLVVDGHCELSDRQYLHKLANAFARSGADCIGRPQPLDVTGATRVQRAIAAARSSPLGHHPDSYIYSATEGYVPAHSVAVAYRRSVFERVGYFDERFDACEDVEFNHRLDQAGLRCFFTPAVTVRYHPRANLSGLFRQLVRYGRGRVRLLRKHPDTISARTLLPAFFVAGCVVGAVAMWFSPTIAAIYLGALAIYSLLVIGASCTIAIRQREIAMTAILPIVFLAIHMGAGTGILLELASQSTADRNSQLP
jgi:succinoglycan biosynthesis protein ExoA